MRVSGYSACVRQGWQLNRKTDNAFVNSGSVLAGLRFPAHEFLHQFAPVDRRHFKQVRQIGSFPVFEFTSQFFFMLTNLQELFSQRCGTCLAMGQRFDNLLFVRGARDGLQSIVERLWAGHVHAIKPMRGWEYARQSPGMSLPLTVIICQTVVYCSACIAAWVSPR